MNTTTPSNQNEPDILIINLLDLNFNIPPVQRGLVWEPQQVMNLWDSLSKGYPIGSFLAYAHADPGNTFQKTPNNEPSGNHASLELLDGQQRYNAICMGTKNEASPQATLWARYTENGDLQFMVCTSCHPWGFCQNGQPFSASEQKEANEQFLGAAGIKEKEFKDLFIKAELQQGYPWLEKGKGFIPVHMLMHTDPDQAWSAWRTKSTNTAYRITETDEKQFRDLHGSPWFQKLRATKVPVILWQQEENSKIDELFTRLNKGGTPLSPIDQSYSAIFVHTGPALKKKNEELADNFLPPEQLAALAARMAYSKIENKWTGDIPADTIQKWFRNEKSTGTDTFAAGLRELYDENGLEHTIRVFKKLCEQDNEETAIPSSIYLKTSQTWLWNILWTIHHFKLKHENQETKKYFPLFCMLPHLLMGSSSTASLIAFCQHFHEGIKDMEQESTLLSLMAVGCANASLCNRCCMYPYPSTQNQTQDTSTQNNNEQHWHQCFTKYQGTSSNPILYYYQRFYMNHMIKGCNFNPGMRAHWSRSSNRPWDMDHIIPASWWTQQETSCHHISNMQVLDFRQNRSKNNHHTTVDLNAAPLQFQNEWNKCLRYNEIYEFTQEIAKGSENHSDILKKRFIHIVKSCINELHLMDLIKEINNLEKQHPSPLPKQLASAIDRYRLMKEVAQELRDDNLAPQWGAVTYRWRQQRKNMDSILTASLSEPDFYHSLVPELSIGIPTNNPFVMATLNYKVDSSVEIGLRRGLGISLEEWHRQQPQNNNDWWLEPLPQKEQAANIVSQIKELSTSL